MISAWPEGPREWSPRMKFCLRVIEKIRRTLPAKLFVEESRWLKVGEVRSYTAFKEGVKESQTAKVVLLVKLNETVEDVSITSNGRISMGVMIAQLLNGHIRGYEYLGKEPFWENV